MPWALGRKLCKAGQSPSREMRAGGQLGGGMLAWHGLGPRTAERERRGFCSSKVTSLLTSVLP